jgi:hypothetical protein
VSAPKKGKPPPDDERPTDEELLDRLAAELRELPPERRDAFEAWRARTGEKEPERGEEDRGQDDETPSGPSTEGHSS